MKYKKRVRVKASIGCFQNVFIKGSEFHEAVHFDFAQYNIKSCTFQI